MGNWTKEKIEAETAAMQGKPEQMILHGRNKPSKGRPAKAKNMIKTNLDLTDNQVEILDKVSGEMGMNRQAVIKMLMEMGFREYYETQALKRK